MLFGRLTTGSSKACPLGIAWPRVVVTNNTPMQVPALQHAQDFPGVNEHHAVCHRAYAWGRPVIHATRWMAEGLHLQKFQQQIRRHAAQQPQKQVPQGVSTALPSTASSSSY
jgi:hypothetical protein